jgi:glycosyltransferase involved in cell wall biosynthesis
MIDPQRTSRRSQTDQPRVALAHDWLVGMRGGELVLDRLARLYGPTTLYTLVSDGRPLAEAIDACEIRASPLQFLPGAAGRMRRWYLPLMPWAVGRLRVEPCDLLISTSSAVMKSIQPPPGAVHLCYCHSPARYIWEQTEDYELGRSGRLRGLGLRLFRKRFQRWDHRTASRVTRFLANSKHTAARIRRCYERDAEVVYPPVRTRFFTPDASVEREDWLLVVSALEPYKRVDLVIDAAIRTGRPLKIIGDGSQRKALEARASGRGIGASRRRGDGGDDRSPIADSRRPIQFLGRVSDEVVLDHYRRAAAFVFPQVEDFGITAVEAQAAGCPVIAMAAGGAQETVTEETGLFFAEQTVDQLAEAIERFFADRSFDATCCRANAERFSEQAFDEAITQQVARLIATIP